MSFLVQLQGKLFSLFSNPKQNETKNKEKIIAKHPDIENSSLCSLLDEQEYKNNQHIRKKYLEASTIPNKKNKLSTLTLIYLILNFSILIFMISLKEVNNLHLDSDRAYGNTKLPKYFHLKQVDPIIFNMLSVISAVIGLIIVLAIYLIANNDRNKKIIKTNKFCLNFALLFGVISQLIQIFMAYDVFLTQIKNINIELKKAVSIELEEIIFIFYVIIFELFGIFSSIELSRVQETNAINLEEKEKWLSYKVISLMYLIMFTFIYVFVFLHKSTLLGLQLSNMEYLFVYYKIILSVFPYIIHINIGIFMFTFYEDLCSFSFGIYTRKIDYEQQLYEGNNNKHKSMY